MNYCVPPDGCGEDFSSVTAFDEHRVGKHAYTYREGLRMNPPREDGRRCLDAGEIESLGLHKDAQGKWRMPVRGTPHWK